jgi:hypothetical protein
MRMQEFSLLANRKPAARVEPAEIAQTQLKLSGRVLNFEYELISPRKD